MKKQLFFLMGLAFLLSNCKDEKPESKTEINTETKNNSASEIATLNAELKKYEVPSQMFTVSSDKKNTVKSKLGTTIYVNPSDLETIDGTPIGKTIDVELKELTNQKQLLRSNAQTVSDGKLLVSGGAYFINITSEKKQLKLKDGKSLTVDFPKLSNEKMSLFYGEKDSLGIMNWKLTDTKFSLKKPVDSLQKKIVYEEYQLESESENGGIEKGDIEDIIAYTDQPKKPLTRKEIKQNAEQRKIDNLRDEVYKSIQIKKLGWINCDRFLEIDNKTDLAYQFNPADSINCANIYLVFKDINSFVYDYYYADTTGIKPEFNDIPVGTNVDLIAVSIKDGNKLSFKTNLKVKKDEKVTIILKETSDQDFKQLFQ